VADQRPQARSGEVRQNRLELRSQLEAGAPLGDHRLIQKAHGQAPGQIGLARSRAQGLGGQEAGQQQHGGTQEEPSPLICLACKWKPIPEPAGAGVPQLQRNIVQFSCLANTSRPSIGMKVNPVE
jgi:hypothetical protein